MCDCATHPESFWKPHQRKQWISQYTLQVGQHKVILSIFKGQRLEIFRNSGQLEMSTTTFFFFLDRTNVLGTDPFKFAWTSFEVLNIHHMWELCSSYPSFLKLLAWDWLILSWTSLTVLQFPFSQARILVSILS